MDADDYRTWLAERGFDSEERRRYVGSATRPDESEEEQEEPNE